MSTARLHRVGVDTGGTFTDVVAEDGSVAKVLSTPGDPAEAVVGSVGAVAAGRHVDVLAHGTTVATNALLTGRLAPTALVTNAGFADLVEIGRQDRPSLYDLWADRPPALVPRSLRHEIPGRLGPDGSEIEPLDLSALDDVDPDVAAVAVCLLHADRNPTHERAVAAALRRRGSARSGGLEVAASHEVSPEFREVERLVTTVIDAGLRPVCRPYLERVAPLADEVLVMTSAGGLVPLAEAAARPAWLLLSGPAAGVLAAATIAAANGFADAVSFDMGGTSTDVALIEGGVPAAAPARLIGGYPVRLPALDVHTIGAGGGSLAGLDPGGALVVGPESAGADPGPACYGRGGTRPTVTDANLVLGRIPAEASFPELGVLDRNAARAALDGARVSAEGVVRVVNAAMERALRRVTVERGVDPAGCALVAFGGAGPLHACDLADALGMAAVVIPPRAGLLSASGLLGAPRRRDLVTSWHDPASVAGLGVALATLAARASGAVGGPAATRKRPAVRVAIDARYPGQSHELTVEAPLGTPAADLLAAFHAEHERRNGYAYPDRTPEVVAVRAQAQSPSPVDPFAGGVPGREPVDGPAVVAEADATTWIPAGWRAEVGEAGAWVVRRRPGRRRRPGAGR